MSIDAANATPDADVVITLEQVADHGFDSALTGVRWADGTVECRARLLDPGGSLVACAGDVGIVLTGRDVSCDTCSDACAT